MKMKKLIAIALMSVMTLSVAGCGGKTESTGSAPGDTSAAESAQNQEAEQEPADESAEPVAENPILKYEGAYSDENGSGVYVLFEAADDVDGVNVSIGYSEETAYTYWELTGKIKDNVITYEDGYKFSMAWGEPDQEEVTEEEIYNDGSGTFEISDDARITWKDNKEDFGKGMVFIWDEEMNAEIQEMMESSDYYYDDAQNPVMNWAGPYTDIMKKERTMIIYSGSEGSADCMVTVTDTPGVEKMIEWVMTGELDEETLTINYTGAVKTEYVFDAQGNTISETAVYEDGTGSFVIDPKDQTLTWNDDKEDAGNGSIFIFTYDYGETGAEEGWTEELPDEAP